MPVDPDGDTRNPGRSIADWCRDCHCRTDIDIDRAVVRPGVAGEDDADPGSSDRGIAADREISLVQDIGAGTEVERGAAGGVDASAIDPGREGFRLLRIDPVIRPRASGIAWHGKTSIRIGG